MDKEIIELLADLIGESEGSNEHDYNLRSARIILAGLRDAGYDIVRM